MIASLKFKTAVIVAEDRCNLTREETNLGMQNVCDKEQMQSFTQLLLNGLVLRFGRSRLQLERPGD